MPWKRLTRGVLHQMGGLAALRLLQRDKFGVLIFHEFDEAYAASLEAICEHISRYYEPVSLAMITNAIHGAGSLPPNAVTVTVDDGYRNFLTIGHPIFKRYGIPTTLYAVASFADRRLWLWTDQIAFVLDTSSKKAIKVEMEKGQMLDLDISSAEAKSATLLTLWEGLKMVPNQRRLEFLTELASMCGVEIPDQPPPHRASLSWEEMRDLAAEGVEIGCHTASHPILSRLSEASELVREIRGAKELMEARLKFKIDHFCYPNGREIDISDAAVACVREAGFRSAVTCTYGLNSLQADPLRIRRLPVGGVTDFAYATETLVGIHC
jgi:peptidoglycan/xylan/chitin deacetylase (PgdA/CDA1 family)